MVSKILVLHGYAQNASIFSKRLASLRRMCGSDIEFVFVDAPHVLNPVDIADAFSPGNNPADASGAIEGPEDPSLTPRGWWYKADAGKPDNGGLEISLAYMREILAKDHFVGVFGFSQGAVMATILCALLEKPMAYPPFLIDGKAPHPRFQYCLAVSGFRAHGPIIDKLFATPYTTPTLHILGRTDVVVIEEKSKTLLDISANKRVEWHDGGHFVPTQPRWRAFMRNYLMKPDGEIASPVFIYSTQLETDYQLLAKQIAQCLATYTETPLTPFLKNSPYVPRRVHSPPRAPSPPRTPRIAAF